MLEQELNTTDIDELSKKFKEIKAEIANIIIGQEEAINTALISLLGNGHCLLIGVPGLAKTLLIKTIAQVLDLSFNRIQFTPDLMPSDITGSEILKENRQFEFIRGPVFSNILLADEINRTPPKTQSALLEAMQEKKVTIGGNSYNLPNPFFVLATQNPIEQEGTYPLPEAQLDRFMYSIRLNYPTFEEEINVVKSTTGDKDKVLSTLLDAQAIIHYQNIIKKIPVTDHVIEYAVQLVSKSRSESDKATDFSKKYIDWGAGPRASQNLIIGAKCVAALQGKYAPDIEDVKAVAIPILSHRIVKNYKAESDGLSEVDIINKLL